MNVLKYCARSCNFLVSCIYFTEQKLAEAAGNGDVNGVRKLLDMGGNINWADPNNVSDLRVCCRV